MFSLIEKGISIIFEGIKALFFFKAGKTAAQAEIQEASIKNVEVAKQVEMEVKSLDNASARNKLRQFTKN
jgi:hypothetical protein